MTSPVKQLVERWRQKEIDAEHHADDPECRGAGLAYGACADELESALSAQGDIRYDEFLAAAKSRGYADLTALVEAHDTMRSAQGEAVANPNRMTWIQINEAMLNVIGDPAFDSIHPAAQKDFRRATHDLKHAVIAMGVNP